MLLRGHVPGHVQQLLHELEALAWVFLKVRAAELRSSTLKQIEIVFGAQMLPYLILPSVAFNAISFKVGGSSLPPPLFRDASASEELNEPPTFPKTSS